jgi:hypothetical protein
MRNGENYKKNKHKPSDTHRLQERVFTDCFDDLFDVASQNALQIMNIVEDREFLTNQRKKGRVGCMIGVDQALARKEARKKYREQKERERKEKHEASSSASMSSSGEFGK